VNKQEAKRILLAFRPDDPADPQITEALQEVERDPDLRQWYERQRAFHRTVSETFRQVTVPAGLKERILARRKIVAPPFWRRRPVLIAAAAAIVLLLALAGLWWRPGPDRTFDTFRSRVVRSALREYRMDIVTNDAAQIRRYLAAQNAPADYRLNARLAKLPTVGAGLLSWLGRPVSMVCLDSGDAGMLFLFVVDRSAVQPAPPGTPEFLRVNKLMTASWTQGERTYVLAGHGAKETLQRYFENSPAPRFCSISGVSRGVSR
jgi:hypothetical protein